MQNPDKRAMKMVDVIPEQRLSAPTVMIKTEVSYPTRACTVNIKADVAWRVAHITADW